MSTPVLTFFNNTGGVGKTTMVYHLAWMFSEMGLRVVAADLDPQANLSAAFLDEERLAELLFEPRHPRTIYGCLLPLKEGVGDIARPHLEPLGSKLTLVVGDMALSTIEDELSQVWPKCLDRDARAFRVTSAFWRVLQQAAEAHSADLVVMDLGPNLGAINRCALIASDFIVIPLGPGLFSLQGLQNLGPALISWRAAWQDRLDRSPLSRNELPPGAMQPVGYMILRHSIRLDRPVQAFERWMGKMPAVYAEAVLRDGAEVRVPDPHCIERLKDYRSLVPLAQEARKPIFSLRPADGALGSHSYAVQEAYGDFKRVALKILRRCGQYLDPAHHPLFQVAEPGGGRGQELDPARPIRDD